MPRANTIRKEISRRNRHEARDRLSEVEAAAERIRCRDDHMIHVTIWITMQDRWEWWPGTARWGGPQMPIHHGSVDMLIAFIKDRRSNPPRPEPEELLIDEGDC